MTDAVNGVADKIRSVLHFSVPDEGPLSDADEYMPDFMELLAEGVGDSEGSLLQKVRSVANSVNNALSDGLTVPDITSEVALANGAGGMTTNNNNTTNLGGIQVTVNGYNAQDDKSLAQMVANKINDMLTEQRAVFK